MAPGKTRVRRTNKQIDDNLFGATQELIIENGFSNLSMQAIYQRAKMEYTMFYKRYKDMNDFLDKFVRDFDYWLNDSIKFDEKRSPELNLQNILCDLIDSLIENPCMQKLLVWEMAEDNYITRRTAQNRDLNCNLFIEYFIDKYKYNDVDYANTCSLLIGGIYYLIIHRQMGTINFIDFSKPEAVEDLKKTIRIIIRKLFAEPKLSQTGSDPVKDEALRIAAELVKNNVDYAVIKQSTQLDDNTLSSLYDKNGKEK